MASPEIELPQLTKDQEAVIAARYLESLQPGFLPYATFLQLARLAVLPTVEIGFVRPSEETEDGAELILTQRPASDKHWPNQWHVPGSAVRADDPIRHEHDHEAVVSRVLAEVGGDVEIVGEPKQFDVVRRRGLRGSEITLRLLAVVEGDPERGRFFDAETVLREPPEGGFVETHEAAIASVAAAYRMYRAEDQ